jgi:hypothetical protein
MKFFQVINKFVSVLAAFIVLQGLRAQGLLLKNHYIFTQPCLSESGF